LVKTAEEIERERKICHDWVCRKKETTVSWNI